MSYIIKPSGDGRYIVHKVKGKINRQTVLPQALEAQALGKKLGINRYNVDVTEARNTDSIMDAYQFAYTDIMKAKGIDKTSRVAVLVSPDDHSHDFIETTCRNVGLTFKIFRDADQARLFLTGT